MVFLKRHNFVLELGQLSLMHIHSVPLHERARLRVYDLCATRTGMPSFQKMLVILWLRRSEMCGILRYDQSTLGGGDFFDGFGGVLFDLCCLPDIHLCRGCRQTCFGALSMSFVGSIYP